MDESKLSNEDLALISEFRALPFYPSYMRKRDTKGGAVPIGILCENLFKKYKIGEPKPQEVILENWKSIIYGDFYKHCYPLSVKVNILYIKTENPAVRQHLSFDKGEILKNVQALDLCDSISEIRFI